MMILFNELREQEKQKQMSKLVNISQGLGNLEGETQINNFCSWIATGASLIGALCVASQFDLMLGFITMLMGALLKAILAYKIKDYSNLTLWFTFCIINITGIIKLI